MIFLTLTRAQAHVIAESTADPLILDSICSQMLSDDIFVDVDLDCAPKLVVFRDDGAGLKCAAMSFTDTAAADRALERFMAGRWNR